MGNLTESLKHKQIERQILLLGIKGSGKTKFLYEFLLQRSWSGKIEPSEGFNYEAINIGQSTYGVWDLSGNKSFRNLWKSFYQFIHFQVAIFVVKVDPFSADTSKDVSKSRKLIHSIVQLEEFNNKLLILIVNITSQANMNNLRNKQYFDEEKNKQKEAFQITLSILKWYEIENPHKLAFPLDLQSPPYDYEQLWMAIDKKYEQIHKTQN